MIVRLLKDRGAQTNVGLSAPPNLFSNCNAVLLGLHCYPLFLNREMVLRMTNS